MEQETLEMKEQVETEVLGEQETLEQEKHLLKDFAVLEMMVLLVLPDVQVKRDILDAQVKRDILEIQELAVLLGALEIVVKKDIRDVPAPLEILVNLVVVVKAAAVAAAVEQNGSIIKQLRGKYKPPPAVRIFTHLVVMVDMQDFLQILQVGPVLVVLGTLVRQVLTALLETKGLKEYLDLVELLETKGLKELRVLLDLVDLPVLQGLRDKKVLLEVQEMLELMELHQPIIVALH